MGTETHSSVLTFTSPVVRRARVLVAGNAEL